MSDKNTDLLHGLLTDLYIGGKAVPAADGRRFEVVDPATGQTPTTDASVQDAIAAIDSADDAAPAWAATPPRQRAEILRRAFELMMGGAEDLARLISLENGKALPDARAEVAYAAEFFGWYFEEAVRGSGSVMTAPSGGQQDPPSATAGRDLCPGHAVELPGGDGDTQDPASTYSRMHRCSQAGHRHRPDCVGDGVDPDGGRV